MREIPMLKEVFEMIIASVFWAIFAIGMACGLLIAGVAWLIWWAA